MKTQKHKKHLNSNIENVGSNTMWSEGMDPNNETEFDEILNEFGLKRTTPIERVAFSVSKKIPFKNIVKDIGRATKNKLSYRFTFTPLQKPKFITVKMMTDLNVKGDEMNLSVVVRPYEEKFAEIMPFGGIYALNGMMVVAAPTEDETAQHMVNVCEGVWQRRLYRFVKPIR